MRVIALVCLCIAALAAVRPPHHNMQGHHKVFSSLKGPNAFPKELQDGALLECYDSFTATWTYLNQSNCFAVFDVLNNNTASDSDLNAAIGEYCSSTCLSTGAQMMINTSVQCKGLWNQTVIDEIANIWFASEVICVKDDTTDNWCLPAFRDIINEFSTNVTVTPALLTQYCVPCVDKIAAAWVRLDHTLEAVVNVTSLSLLCEKRNGTWCYVNFINMIGLGDAAPYTPQVTCHECTWAFIRKFEFIDEAKIVVAILNGDSVAANASLQDLIQVESLKVMLGVACPQDLHGVYCFPQISAFLNTSGGNFNTSCGAGFNILGLFTSCPSACSDFITQAKTNLGCCFGTMINFLNLNAAITFAETGKADFTYDTVLDTCGISAGLGCAEIRALKAEVTLTVAGLDYSWCVNNLVTCTALIRNVTGYLAGVYDSDFQNVSVTGTVQGSATGRRLLQTAGTSVTVVVSSSNQEATTSFASNVDAAPVPNALFNVPSSAQTSGGGSGGIALVVEGSSLSGSAGSFVAPSIVLALVAIFAALL